MKIGPREVAHIASLAALEITEDELATVAHDLERIVSFVEQLGEVPPGEPPTPVGPASLTLREDVVNPVPLERSPQENAPEWSDSFFVVPGLEGLGDE